MRSITTFLILFFALSTVAAQKSHKAIAALEFQNALNRTFRNPETSPLPEEDRKDFESLDFFPVDTSLYIVADFVRTPFEAPFVMPTTTERKPLYVKYGEAYFVLEGKEYKLNLYQDLQLAADSRFRNYLFLPFTDLTNGTTTYGGGRYLDMQIPKSNKIIIDFNQSYNPYCAYNGEYSCPIPPEENHLNTYIRAGVKKFKE